MILMLVWWWWWWRWRNRACWCLCLWMFTVDQDVRYTAVSSFIFLRFFAPAILSPNLFQLRPHHPVSVFTPHTPHNIHHWSCDPPADNNISTELIEETCICFQCVKLCVPCNMPFLFFLLKDPCTSRTLTLISKTIQTLGSLAKSKSVSRWN